MADGNAALDLGLYEKEHSFMSWLNSDLQPGTLTGHACWRCQLLLMMYTSKNPKTGRTISHWWVGFI